VAVRFQQGRPALDRELNLAADLASPQRLAARYLGNGLPARRRRLRHSEPERRRQRPSPLPPGGHW